MVHGDSCSRSATQTAGLPTRPQSVRASCRVSPPSDRRIHPRGRESLAPLRIDRLALWTSLVRLKSITESAVWVAIGAQRIAYRLVRRTLEQAGEQMPVDQPGVAANWSSTATPLLDRTRQPKTRIGPHHGPVRRRGDQAGGQSRGVRQRLPARQLHSAVSLSQDRLPGTPLDGAEPGGSRAAAVRSAAAFSARSRSRVPWRRERRNSARWPLTATSCR